MHDLRFYRSIRDVSVRDLASLVGGKVVGDENQEVITIAPAEQATAGVLSYFTADNRSFSGRADLNGVCLTTLDKIELLPDSITKIVVEAPQKAFTQCVSAFLAQRTVFVCGDDLGASSIAETAKVHSTATISEGVEIGANTQIGPNCVIGPGVRIGRDCILGAGVSVEAALIGNEVSIKSNSVLGGAGFGLFPGSEGLSAMPHFGRVIVQDRVGIGSCVCIDRGVFDDTVIGEGSKLDNLIHIGHNVVIGRNSFIAAFGGIAGSVTIGDWVQMGGRVGVSDHLNVGDFAKIAVNSAVLKNVPGEETWGGAPAQPIRKWRREVAWLSKNANKKNYPAKE